jgi:hypothetical protein
VTKKRRPPTRPERALAASRELATAIIVERRQLFTHGEYEWRSQWYPIYIQDGYLLFSKGFLWGRVGEGFIEAFKRRFPTEWNRPGWPKVVLDDGGWYARAYGYTKADHRDEEETIRVLFKNIPSSEAREIIEEHEARFLSLGPRW